jgi:hypothetical protein
MTQSCVRAFVRRARVGVLVAVTALLGASTLMAQGSTGKLEGRVRDQAGAPIANAQVFIVGTTFQTQTSPAGYYFVNNIPAGTVTLQAGFIGYKSTQVTNVVILAGQTITQDVALEATPFQVEELTVTAAEVPLVPRDQVTTKHRLGGAFGDKLPVDRIQNALALQPGVVASNSGGTLSIRGGRPDEAVVYIDGVPTTAGNRGTGFGGVFVSGSNTGNAGTGLVATNSFEEASITTGSSSAEFGNAQSGIISISTKSGGPTYSGSFAYATDEMFGGSQQGINFINASIGGPIAGGLTFFVGGLLEGQRSLVTGKGADDFPLFVVAGVDTTVAVPSALGDPTADTTYVAVERYAVYRGKSDVFAGSANADIASNYGFDTKGIREPGTGASNYKLTGKLNYTFGGGSRVSITGLATQNQNRNTLNFNRSNAQSTFATRNWNRNLTVNWTQNLSKSAERALALEVFGSYQTDRQIFSPLTRESEVATYQPTGGFYIKPYEFVWDFDNFPVDDQLIENFKSNIIGSRRSPYDLEDRDQYREADVYRNNPWGRQDNLNSSGVGAESGGPEGRLQLVKEDRYIGKANLDWQLDRYNRVKLGGEYTKYKMTTYTHQVTSQAFSDAYKGEPTRYNFFIQDRLDLGDVVLEGGLRYDYFNTEAIRPYLLDTDPNSPTFQEYIYFPRTNTYLGAAAPGIGPSDCGTEVDPVSGLTGCSLTTFRQDESHNYLSPHIQVAFPVTDRTNFRLSYAHQVQTPDFGLIYGGMNTDLAITNTNHVYGSDLDFGRTITFEFGIRHSFNDDMVLDISAYNKDNLSNAAGRLVRLTDPAKNINQDIRLMTNADFGNTKGIDLRLDRRFGNLFNGTVSYTFQDAKNTGSDPRTYINFGSRIVQQVTGGNQPPPQAILPLNSSRPHTLAGSFALTFPNDWQEGSAIGSILKNVGLFTTFRIASGTSFTRCPAETGNEGVLSGNVCSREFDGDQNGARLPTFKQLDLRVTKGFALRGVDVTVFADARNVLNFENIIRVFAATNDVRSLEAEEKWWRSDSATWATEGAANGVYDAATGDMDMTFGSGLTDLGMCANWANQAGEPNAPNCIYLIRAEQRYGDGDGVYSAAEQRAASDAAYGVTGLNIANNFGGAGGRFRFLGAERAVRVGFELNF